MISQSDLNQISSFGSHLDLHFTNTVVPFPSSLSSQMSPLRNRAYILLNGNPYLYHQVIKESTQTVPVSSHDMTIFRRGFSSSVMKEKDLV